MAEREIDRITGTETTGHEWDGIKELNTPLPRWWLWTFYVTIVWAIGYWIAMPSWPLINDYSRGLLGFSQRANIAEDIAAAKAAQAGLRARIAAASLEQIRTDPQLLEFALAGGRSAFSVNCSQCHGTGAQGFVGYPNLNDDDWLWGGTLADIATTIRYGVRSGHEEARANDMPAFVTDEILTRDEARAVAEYVLTLSGQEADPDLVARGEPLFEENCVACHGQGGVGDQELGAPNLSDAIWLYGGDRESILRTISAGRGGVMPTWEARLDPVTIKQLAVFVHSLGGGE